MGKFTQLFCLQRKHVRHTNLGTWGLANSIWRFCETPQELNKAILSSVQNFPIHRESLSRFTNWRGISPTAIEDASKGKVWKTSTVRAIVQPLLSLPLPIGKQKKSAKLSKKKTQKQPELTYRFLPISVQLNGATLFCMENTNSIEIW